VLRHLPLLTPLTPVVIIFIDWFLQLPGAVWHYLAVVLRHFNGGTFEPQLFPKSHPSSKCTSTTNGIHNE
jgi:hypothetical protein